VAEVAGPVFPSAPPERIDLDGQLALVRMRPEMADAVASAINSSLDHLAPWMAWASEPATEPGLATFLAAAETLWDDQRDFGYSIVERSRVVGGAGLHGRQGPDALDIGYWVHVDRAGRGLATRVARALTDAAFTIDGIERVRIQCDERNVRSARIPEKLGYRLTGSSPPGEEHPDRLATLDWVVDRATWIAERATPQS
jgi:RimJ/RimL family protein N-acetyltransferase